MYICFIFNIVVFILFGMNMFICDWKITVIWAFERFMFAVPLWLNFRPSSVWNFDFWPNSVENSRSHTAGLLNTYLINYISCNNHNVDHFMFGLKHVVLYFFGYTVLTEIQTKFSRNSWFLTKFACNKVGQNTVAYGCFHKLHPFVTEI